MELRPRLWSWELPHPEWTPEEAEDGGWEELVSSYAVVAGDQLVLIDPLAPGDGEQAEGFWRALDDDVAHHGAPSVLVTVHWHARSAQAILDRYPGASVWAHEPAAEEVAKRTRVTNPFQPGEELPGGAVAHPTVRGSEVVFWLPSHRALVVGDVLLGAGPEVRGSAPSRGSTATRRSTTPATRCGRCSTSRSSSSCSRTAAQSRTTPVERSSRRSSDRVARGRKAGTDPFGICPPLSS